MLPCFPRSDWVCSIQKGALSLQRKGPNTKQMPVEYKAGLPPAPYTWSVFPRRGLRTSSHPGAPQQVSEVAVLNTQPRTAWWTKYLSGLQTPAPWLQLPPMQSPLPPGCPPLTFP